MSEEVRPGLLVVVLAVGNVLKFYPEAVGQVFTIRSGPHRWRPRVSERVVWYMEEKHDDGSFWCFARDEFRPLPPPDEMIERCREHTIQGEA